MAKKQKGDDDGKIMSLPECANYLHLSESTVLRLATDNKLPGVLETDKTWKFRKELVDEWLQERLNLGEEEGIREIPDPMRVPLGDLLPEEAVLDNLRSKDALGIIEELAALAYSQGWLNDKPWFVGAVVERESLSSTAMEGGVAFLHTRAREATKIARPFIIVGRSYEGVDFGAPDGRPTFLFFLLGLKYDRLHLPILGRLARTMLNPVTIGKLRAQPSVTKIRALLLKEDSRAMTENKQVPVHYEAMKPKLDRQMRLRTIMRLNALRKHEAKKKADEEKKKAKLKSKKSAAGGTAASAKRASSKKTAETSKKTAKTSKKAAETSKKAAETSKKAAETSKKAAKTPAATKKRTKADSSKKTASK